MKTRTLGSSGLEVSAMWIVPIPGTRKLDRLEENIGGISVELTDADLREINDAASRITIQGARLPEEVLKLTNR